MNINATVIGQLFSFFVFVFICYKYIWPPIVKAMDERKEKIAAGLAAAEDAQKSLVEAQARSEDLTKDAKQQSLEIISDAKKRANAMIEEAKSDAKLEADRQIAMARSEIEQEAQRAKDELRKKCLVWCWQQHRKLLSVKLITKRIANCLLSCLVNCRCQYG